jgi:gas vesicle protein
VRSYERLQSQLCTKLNEVRKHHEKCNIAKTVGAGLSTVGTVVSVTGLIMAPFTGGLLLGLAAAGFASSAVATNIVTDVVDGKATAKFSREVAQTCESAARAQEKLVEQYEAGRNRLDELRAEVERMREEASEVERTRAEAEAAAAERNRVEQLRDDLDAMMLDELASDVDEAYSC